MRKLLLQAAFIAIAFSATSQASAQTGEMEQNMFETIRESDRAAVVAVHTGSNDAKVQERIKRFNDKLRKAFPNCEFREAWISRGTAGSAALSTPDELLSQLKKEGFTHVLIQPSSLANSIGLQSLRATVETAKDWFKQIRIGTPLLSSIEDYEKLADITAKAYGTDKTAKVLIYTGDTSEEDSQLALLDYVLRDKGMTNWHVCSTNGYPSIESLKRQLKAGKAKKVHLIPFTFDEHTQDTADRSIECMQALQKAGYKVTTESRCVGDLDDIIDMYEQHCKHAEYYRKLTAKERQFLRR